MEPEAPKSPETLATKIDRLFRSVRSEGRREYTYEEVVAGIRDRGGETISASYLWSLRTGAKDNPRKKHLEALADFFGVPPAYFFDDDEVAGRIAAQLELLPVFLDADVQRIALRAADLSPASLRAIAGMIEHARDLEKLRDDDTDNARPPDGAKGPLHGRENSPAAVRGTPPRPADPDPV